MPPASARYTKQIDPSLAPGKHQTPGHSIRFAHAYERVELECRPPNSLLSLPSNPCLQSTEATDPPHRSPCATTAYENSSSVCRGIRNTCCQSARSKLNSRSPSSLTLIVRGDFLAWLYFTGNSCLGRSFASLRSAFSYSSRTHGIPIGKRADRDLADSHSIVAGDHTVPRLESPHFCMTLFVSKRGRATRLRSRRMERYRGGRDRLPLVGHRHGHRYGSGTIRISRISTARDRQTIALRQTNVLTYTCDLRSFSKTAPATPRK